MYAESSQLHICISRLVPKGASRWPKEANIRQTQEGQKEEKRMPQIEPTDGALLSTEILAR